MLRYTSYGVDRINQSWPNTIIIAQLNSRRQSGIQMGQVPWLPNNVVYYISRGERF